MLMYLYFVFRAKNTKYILMSDIFRQWASTSSAVTLSWLLPASKFWQFQIYLCVHPQTCIITVSTIGTIIMIC